METATISPERLTDILRLLDTETIWFIVASERENGRAFGVTAETCRAELVRRGERL
jgi:hypothetical protein